ncbi:MAG: hypothetical protein JW982_14870, partial [Spirochaetes bacterium]|nr:hypothetical protein [Spirochaetota bacterium]
NSEGIFKNRLYSKVGKFSENINIMPVILEPVIGAAFSALINAGIKVDRNFILSSIDAFKIKFSD